MTTNLDINNEALHLPVWRVNDEMKAKFFHEVEFHGKDVMCNIIWISILYFQVGHILSGSNVEFVHLAGQECASMPEMF